MNPKSDRCSTLINIEGFADQQPLEQSPDVPVYDVFLGGSCGNTCWRSDIVIPYLKKHAISYYNPQRPAWSKNMIHEEQQAKENSRIFLFVLDPGTINATSFLEIAYLASRKASKLVVVFLGRHEWSDKALRVDLPDRIRTCNLLEAILKRHSVLMLTSIDQALDFVDAKIIGGKRWADALRTPEQRMPFLKLRARRCAARCKSRWRSTARQCRARLATHLKRFALLLLFETFAVMGIAFLLSTNALPLAIPLWAIVLPLLAFNYMLLLSLIIYYKFKSHKRKKKVHRSLQLPVPPLPRVHTLPESLASIATQQHHACTASDRRQRSFRCAKKSSEHSSSTASTSGGEDGAYGPIIELLINGSTNGASATAAGKKFKQSSNIFKEPKLNKKRIDSCPFDRVRLNGYVTSPVGYDVFLSCSSSSELDWITQKAVPELHKNGLSYTSALMVDNEMRIPFLHTATHILYYIPSYKTFLSGMIEIAYFIGHSDWQVTVCVPREAECLVLLEDVAMLDPEIRRAVARRNECYLMAYSYLKDMAAQRHIRVFTRVAEAIRHIRDATLQEVQQQYDAKMGGNTTETDQHHPQQQQQQQQQQQHNHQQKRTQLRQILEKQHLVKERTSQNLLAHLREATARGQKLELDLAEIRPDDSMTIDLNQLRPHMS
uniref:Protein kinase domain-containing protein n=1 Tax=Globodera pallida TaxID=36090 RepID=A0A183C0K1_GLOPA